MQNKKWRWWAPPPLPIIFEGQNLPPTNLYIGKGIYRRVRFILDIDKIFWFRDFMSNFREMTPQKNDSQKKFQTFKIWPYYISFKGTWSVYSVYRPIYFMKFSASIGDQLEYNGRQGASRSDSTEKFKLWVLESTTNASIMYMLIQLLKEQLSLVATQCLFHAPTTSDHAQLRPEDAIILQFWVALAMWHHGIFVYINCFAKY